jgi:hypothetical protein
LASRQAVNAAVVAAAARPRRFLASASTSMITRVPMVMVVA